MSVSTFDQVLEEVNKTNQIKDSYDLIKMLLHTHSFEDYQTIIFLNKKTHTFGHLALTLHA